jgi:uncharacterized protein YcfJ
MRHRTLALHAAVAAVLAAPMALAQDYNRSYPNDPSWSERREAREELREQRREDRREERREAREWRDSARVISSQPLYARDTKQECFNPRLGRYEEVQEQNRTRIGKGAAAGAVAGGVIGHQVDSGTGTAAGAVLGGLLGHHLQGRNERNEQDDLDFSRCRIASHAGNNGEIEGYAVRYEHQGREYVTRLERDPGERLVLGRDVKRDGTPFDNIAYDTTGPDYARR